MTMVDEIRNILFIMYDQLRHDYLSCAGHKTLHTPHMDRLAGMGLRFSNAYVQSPVCGSSRMSFYTGRYVSSHGAAYNGYPLKVGELTVGDHLRKLGVDSWLIGKTHMQADAEGMARLGLAPDSVIGARVAECGFDVWDREDGLYAHGPKGRYGAAHSPYNDYLSSLGYPGENPWHDFANAGDDGGDLASGWFMKNAGQAANIAEDHSETPWLTRRAIDFMDSAEGAAPWMAHLSFIKPHWPYIVPAPYHNMYGPDDVQPAIRHEVERQNPHPVLGAYQASPVGQAFARDDVRAAVIPAYMGLIKQCDDQLGVLLDYLESSGRMDDTMIVLTSDHGDYLGDHWLGEKDLFHQPSVKVPLIIYDPRPSANATRGQVCDALVEAIDLAPTFVEAKGGQVPDHILEGRSLLPLLAGQMPDDWRDFVVSEYDYATSPMAEKLGLEPRDCRLFMLADARYTYIHAEGGFRPILFDRETDPEEFFDRGGSAEYTDVLDMMQGRLARWARRMSQRTTQSEAQLRARRNSSADIGVMIGVWDERDVTPEQAAYYKGAAPRK